MTRLTGDEVANEAMRVNSLPYHKKLWLGSILGSQPLHRRYLSQDYVDLILLEVDDLEESALPPYIHPDLARE